MTEPSDLDDAVRDLAYAVLGQRQSELSDAGLRATVEVKRWSKDGRDSSELRVVFWREKAFINLVEDFITKDDKPAASLGEFRRWLVHEIDDIVQQSR